MVDTGKLYLPKTSAELSQLFRDDLELEALSIGIASPPVQYGTDWWLLSEAEGRMAILLVALIQNAESNSSVLSAVGVSLDTIRKAYGLPVAPPTYANGKVKVGVVSGTVSINNGTPITINSVQYTVDGTHMGVADEDEIDVVCSVTGDQGNQVGGTAGSFSPAPLGVKAALTVSYAVPLTGGTDTESPQRMRDRIRNRLQNTPAGGNAGHIIELANSVITNLDGVYVYPALGGPGSAKVVPVKAIDPDSNDFSRTLDSSALNLVRQEIYALTPTPMWIVVQASADEAVDVSLIVDIPDSILAGGDGTGWLDETPWPPITTGGSGTGYDFCAVTTSPTSTTQITVSSQDATGPSAGQTQISWWAPGDQKFRTYLVTAVAGSAGAWQLTVDRPMLDSDNNSVAAGDWICPAATHMDEYGKAWRDIMGTLGPGENTSDPYRPFALRYPTADFGTQSDINTKLLVTLVGSHDSLRGASYQYRSLTAPTVPSSIDTAPNVLTLDNFGIYPE